MSEIIVCSPLRGAWQVVISPADHIPSHYTEMLGISYAFDFAKRKDPEDLATTSFLETIHLYGHKLRWEDSPSFVYIQWLFVKLCEIPVKYPALAIDWSGFFHGHRRALQPATGCQFPVG
ncbi:MAG: hypothetical protein L3K24_16600, partial [Gammaproteobacteria bacterium]|nr:hypothetical protein [Gammaproteobacteria bacterium]